MYYLLIYKMIKVPQFFILIADNTLVTKLEITHTHTQTYHQDKSLTTIFYWRQSIDTWYLKLNKYFVSIVKQDKILFVFSSLDLDIIKDPYNL